MHLCQDELALLAAAQAHVHCVVCWARVAWAWIRCRIDGHHRGEG